MQCNQSRLDKDNMTGYIMQFLCFDLNQYLIAVFLEAPNNKCSVSYSVGLFSAIVTKCLKIKAKIDFAILYMLHGTLHACEDVT